MNVFMLCPDALVSWNRVTLCPFAEIDDPIRRSATGIKSIIRQRYIERSLFYDSSLRKSLT